MQVERYSHVMHIVSTVDRARCRRGATRWTSCARPSRRARCPGRPSRGRWRSSRSSSRRGAACTAACVGYLDAAGDMDMAIAIRTAVLHQGTAYVQAGAGLVADSDPATEQAECEQQGGRGAARGRGRGDAARGLARRVKRGAAARRCCCARRRGAAAGRRRPRLGRDRAARPPPLPAASVRLHRRRRSSAACAPLGLLGLAGVAALAATRGRGAACWSALLAARRASASSRRAAARGRGRRPAAAAAPRPRARGDRRGLAFDARWPVARRARRACSRRSADCSSPSAAGAGRRCRRRYEAPAGRARQRPARPRPEVAAWDALDRGEDPTADPRPRAAPDPVDGPRPSDAQARQATA